MRPAQGPDGLGCQLFSSGSGSGDFSTPLPTQVPWTSLNCKETEFGCCPDETTAGKRNSNVGHLICYWLWFLLRTATGLNYAGCDIPCHKTTFGCCDDNVTAAHGARKEGCCLNTEYGCCPDNIGAAQGPKLEGCSCEYSPYGCCPDNSTAARGPNNDGCGCQYTEHGCCPDNYTPAAGSDYQGCGCHTFQHGCCPDSMTIARGPNLEGCGCENTAHGCCPDGRTPAQGPQFEHCGCEASRYGCCLDGQTEAAGSNFAGCPEKPAPTGGPYPPLPPLNNNDPFYLWIDLQKPSVAEVCALEKERGSCRNFTVKWFYDMEYGGCSRFWYGGCDGNENRFSSQEECRGHCIEPEGMRKMIINHETCVFGSFL